LQSIVDGGVLYTTVIKKRLNCSPRILQLSVLTKTCQLVFLAHRTEFERDEDSNIVQQQIPTCHSKSEVQTVKSDEINEPFELHELSDALRECKSKSSPGEDRVSYVLLKQIPRNCQTVLLQFFNKIWHQGLLPPDWKNSIVIPLLKADRSASDIASYRPIALTSTLCKVMERMAAKRLRW